MNDMTRRAPSSASEVLRAKKSFRAATAGSRMRILRLVRPLQCSNIFTPDTNFGFSVRGGREHGIGFFVSAISKNSEADIKGLRVGDQIIQINGFNIDEAVHKEFIQLVTSNDRITLKVRSAGLLPIQNKERDFVSFYNVPEEYAGESIYQAPLDANIASSKNFNVVLNVAPNAKLGLGICKGPAWKPGIFVLFTKENSVAREAGLRPGDQIISVNGISFCNVLISEAVAVMKQTNKLEMIVRNSEGCDFLPAESSGYNSSTSSVTGDQSPCWGDIRGSTTMSVNNNNTNLCEDYNSQNTCRKIAESKGVINKTVIKLVGNSTLDEQNSFKVQEIQQHQQPLNQQKTTTTTTTKITNSIETSNYCNVERNSNVNDNSDTNTLSAAITQELKKRKEKKNNSQQETANQENANHTATSTSSRTTMERKSNDKAAGGLDNKKVENYHSALMDEFKRVHQRMILKEKASSKTEQNTPGLK